MWRILIYFGSLLLLNSCRPLPSSNDEKGASNLVGFEKLIKAPESYDLQELTVKGFLMTTEVYPLGLFPDAEKPSYDEANIIMSGILIDDKNFLNWNLDEESLEVHIKGVFSKPLSQQEGYGSLSSIKEVRILYPSSQRPFHPDTSKIPFKSK